MDTHPNVGVQIPPEEHFLLVRFLSLLRLRETIPQVLGKVVPVAAVAQIRWRAFGLDQVRALEKMIGRRVNRGLQMIGDVVLVAWRRTRLRIGHVSTKI